MHEFEELENHCLQELPVCSFSKLWRLKEINQNEHPRCIIIDLDVNFLLGGTQKSPINHKCHSSSQGFSPETPMEFGLPRIVGIADIGPPHT